MKFVLLGMLLVAVGAPLCVAWWVDVPTAIFVFIAWSVVCACGSAPVVFSVVTRRNDVRRMELDEAEEIGRRREL